MSAYRDNDNNIGNRLCMLINVMILFTLVACSSDSVVIEEPEPRPTSPPELNEATSFSGPLVKAGQSNVSRKEPAGCP